MVSIIDYGVGNLFSLVSTFSVIGEDAVITNDEKVIRSSDRIILPGVGAFGDAAEKISQGGMDGLLKDEVKSGKPLLGICLGMQLLLEKSYEYGEHEGLGLIPGEIRPITDVIPEGYKVPHIGWNSLEFKKESALFSGIPEGAYVYFVHSYHGTGCEDYTSAVTEYGGILTASVENGNVFGTQFHPEKSGEIGIQILKNFCRI